MKILADNGFVKLIEESEQRRGLELSQDEQALHKRAHDLSGAMAALKFVVRSVKSRYEFNEDEARTLGESAEKALALVDEDTKFMLAVYTKR